MSCLFIVGCAQKEQIIPMYNLSEPDRKLMIEKGCNFGEFLVWKQESKYEESQKMTYLISCLNGEYVAAFDTNQKEINMNIVFIGACKRYVSTKFYLVDGYSFNRAHEKAKLFCETYGWFWSRVGYEELDNFMKYENENSK